MRKNRFLGAALALTMTVCTVIVPASAANTDVMLESDVSAPEIFHVVVPAEVPIHMGQEGKIQIASNLEIQNKSDRAVEVVNIQVDGKNGWDILAFDEDFSDKPVNTHDLAMRLRGDGTTDTGHVAPASGNWTIAAGANLNILPEAKLPLQTYSTKTSIATITWTIDWAKDINDGDDASDVKITVLPGDHGYSDTKSLTPNKTGLVESYPDVVPDTGYEFTNWVNAETSGPVDESTVYTTDTSIRPVFALKSGWTRIPVPETENVTFVPEKNPEILVDPDGIVQVVPEIVPAPGYVTDGIEDSDGNPVTPGSNININITVNVTVIVRPENPDPGPETPETPETPDNTVTLPVLPGVNGDAGNGEVTTDKDGKIPDFPPVTPDEGYVFDHWEDEDGNPVDKDTVFDKPTGIKPVCVPDPDYKPDKTTEVGILPGEHGNADADKVATDSDGRIPQFPSVTPDEGYEHAGWEKPDGTPVDENTVFGPGDEIRPTFEKKPNPVVTVLPGEHGAANVDKVQTDNSHKIPAFPDVNPNEGYIFDHWESSDGVPVNQDTVFQEGDTIRPVFTKAATKYTVTVVDSENGMIEDKTVNISDNNEIVSLPDATPAPGYDFSRYEDQDGNTVSVGDVLTENITIHPVYDLKATQDFVITASNRSEVGYTGETGEVLNIPAEFIGSDGNRYKPVGIESSAFKNCSNLSSVTVPSGVKYINSQAFYGCSGMQSITLPNTLTSIGQQALGSTGLTSCKLPNSLTSVGSYLFMGSWSLKTCNIPTGISATSTAMFASSGISSVTIPNNIKTIGDSTFQNCSNLKSITIPSSVTSLGWNAFNRCGLTSITIPNSVTSIGTWCFEGCNSLKSATIGTGVTAIPSQCFFCCANLTSVSLPSNLKSIDGDGFGNCTSLSITVPKGVTSIGGSAFTNVPHVYYQGSASGKPWNAKEVNGVAY